MSLKKRSAKVRIPFTSRYIGTPYIVFLSVFVGLIGFSHGSIINISIKHLPIYHIADHRKNSGNISCKGCHSIRCAHKAKDFGTAHKAIAGSYPNSCSRCHRQEFCSECHKHYTGHPSRWVTTHKTHPQKGCDTCHSKKFCSDCHETSKQKTVAAKLVTVQQAETKLESIHHDTSVGRRIGQIHTKGSASSSQSSVHTAIVSKNTKPSSHIGTWLSTHGKAALTERKECITCHNRSYCTSCHGVEMPHPEGWDMNHKEKGASLDEGSICLKCHNKEEFCGGCHQ